MNVARKNLLILILLHFIFVFLSQKGASVYPWPDQ